METAIDSNFFNASFLFASLFWGSVGVGYFVYGKKQAAWPALAGGLLMIVISYFVGSWFWMSLLCLGLAFAVYWLIKQGY